MNGNKPLDQTASAIADSIVKLVERTDGPVTLATIEREIRGFAADRYPKKSLGFERRGVIWTIWSGMSKAGSAALRDVTSGYKVAVQHVNALAYSGENRVLQTEHWLPIVLLPRRAGNLRTPNWLVRASPTLREDSLALAAEIGLPGCVGLVTPRGDGVMADRFAVA